MKQGGSREWMWAVVAWRSVGVLGGCGARPDVTVERCAEHHFLQCIHAPSFNVILTTLWSRVCLEDAQGRISPHFRLVATACP